MVQKNTKILKFASQSPQKNRGHIGSHEVISIDLDRSRKATPTFFFFSIYFSFRVGKISKSRKKDPPHGAKGQKFPQIFFRAAHSWRLILSFLDRSQKAGPTFFFLATGIFFSKGRLKMPLFFGKSPPQKKNLII